MKAPRWLDRSIILAPCFTLCTTAQQLQRAMSYLKVPLQQRVHWPDAGCASTTVLERAGARGLACVVCIHVEPGEDPIEVAALLVHEAVHIYQAACDDMRENKPGDEFEAYSIQALSRQLMHEYVRQTKRA